MLLHTQYMKYHRTTRRTTTAVTKPPMPLATPLPSMCPKRTTNDGSGNRTCVQCCTYCYYRQETQVMNLLLCSSFSCRGCSKIFPAAAQVLFSAKFKLGHQPITSKLRGDCFRRASRSVDKASPFSVLTRLLGTRGLWVPDSCRLRWL